nr:TylF/MycF/NovP-related O-methyltransferase [Nitrosomonas nitrosa]
MHIQKTAGTTIVDLARSAYGNHNVMSHDDYLKGINYSPLTGEFSVDEKVLHDFHNMPFLSGHFGYGFAKRYMPGRYSFTFLRDPIERILSFYYFCRGCDPAKFALYKLSQQLTLDEFLQRGLVDQEVKNFIWNNQVWQLASGFGDVDTQQLSFFEGIELLELAGKHLEEFSHIGFTETFEVDRDRILRDLGIVPPEARIVSNASLDRPTYSDLPQTTKDLLLELTELDRVFYEKARSRKSPSLKQAVNEWPRMNIILKPESPQELLQHMQNEYLELLQACLTGSIYGDLALAPFGLKTFDSHLRERGLDWPSHAETMIGGKRLANLRVLTETVVADNVPGDLIETGVWRGGACILMRAVLYAHNVSDRYIWVADSFEGLPRANELQYPADAGSDFHTYAQLAVSLNEVKDNFRAYGLLDEQVKFLKGWFKETLPTAPIDRLALMRLDGDMYESTMDALTNLYPKLSHQGYVIIDDYHVVPACKAAVTDYCDRHGIKPEIVEIDGVGVYWRKTIVGESDRESIQPNQTVTFTESQITQLSQAVAELSRSVITHLNQSLKEREEQIAYLNRSLVERDAQITTLNRSLVERDAQITTLNRSLVERDAQITYLKQSVAELHSSTSWKITKPLRSIRQFIDAVQSSRQDS